MLVKRMFQQATIRNSDRRLPTSVALPYRRLPFSARQSMRFRGRAARPDPFAIRMAPFCNSRSVGRRQAIYRRAMALPLQVSEFDERNRLATRIEAAAGPIPTARPELP
ncbi:hypothetical protein GCM10027610_029880 [Dactylosporangium cerinum]